MAATISMTTPTTKEATEPITIHNIKFVCDAFQQACTQGNLDMVKEIYTDSFESFKEASYKNENDWYCHSRAFDAIHNGICDAVSGNHFNIVRFLVESDWYVNGFMDDEPLHKACITGKLDMAKYLHEKGEEVNDLNSTFYGACLGRHRDVAEWIMSTFPSSVHINHPGISMGVDSIICELETQHVDEHEKDLEMATWLKSAVKSAVKDA
jgi:hypothetical protein